MPEKVENTSKFKEFTESKDLSVVHFAADWVEQCKQIDEVIDALATKSDYANVKFLRCEAEELSEISFKYKVDAAPTVILFRSGKEIARVDGANPSKIANTIKEHLTEKKVESDNTWTLQDKLKSLINRKDIMLFIKGTPEDPRCGFSKTIVGILKDLRVDFATFDILSDDEVRQGLKAYSDWPTYPQLYVKGELLGGLDIVKELQKAGELNEALGLDD